MYQKIEKIQLVITCLVGRSWCLSWF